MWPLKKPKLDARTVFETCISKVRNAGLKGRLESIADDIHDAAEEYEAGATDTELHLIAQATNVGGVVTADEMVKVYKGRMVPATSPGRADYDTIVAGAPHSRCPLCGHRVVSTLDHVLGKAQYPALAVSPLNLVPSCADCNKSKLTASPATAEDEFLHPYFDDIENDLWLMADVVQSSPVSIRFYVEPNAAWDATMSARVENHFRLLGLNRLYTSQAAEEFLNIRHQLEGLHAQGGAAAVRDFLQETRESRKAARVNSWQTAFYTATADSGWYCDGGFSA